MKRYNIKISKEGMLERCPQTQLEIGSLSCVMCEHHIDNDLKEGGIISWLSCDYSMKFNREEKLKRILDV